VPAAARADLKLARNLLALMVIEKQPKI